MERPNEQARPQWSSGVYRVLVVDDNDDGREALAAWIKARGQEVRTASDGYEALGAARSFRPHIILLDIAMPEMDGYEVCSRLRVDDRGAEVAIYAITGFGSDEHRRRAARAGFDGYFVKPLNLALLSDLWSHQDPLSR
jgi:CheY-like chemotaxis protein